MRAVLIFIILLILAAIALVATGLVNISQITGARAPEITATQNGVTAKGGQPPAFDVQTGSVKIGTKETTVKVPAIEVQRAQDNQAAAITNNSM